LEDGLNPEKDRLAMEAAPAAIFIDYIGQQGER
jgi:hypothetical protein